MARKKTPETSKSLSLFDPRVPQLSEDARQALLDGIQTYNLNITEAAESVGISRSDFRRLCEADPEFRERCNDATEAVVDKMLAKGVALASAGSIDMLKFLLPAFRKEQFSTKSKLDIRIEDVTKLDDDALDRMVEQLRSKLGAQ